MKVLLFLTFWTSLVFAETMNDCGTHLNQYVKDMLSDGEYPECFWEPSSNTLGIFLKNESAYAILYDDDAMTVCIHNQSRFCSTYYECATRDNRTGQSGSFCQTKKKSKEIKNRLKRAKYDPATAKYQNPAD